MDDELFEFLEEERKVKENKIKWKYFTLEFYSNSFKPFFLFVYYFLYSIFFPMKRADDVTEENSDANSSNRNRNPRTNTNDATRNINRVRPGFRYRSRGGG